MLLAVILEVADSWDFFLRNVARHFWLIFKSSGVIN